MRTRQTLCTTFNNTGGCTASHPFVWQVSLSFTFTVVFFSACLSFSLCSTTFLFAAHLHPHLLSLMSWHLVPNTTVEVFETPCRMTWILFFKSSLNYWKIVVKQTWATWKASALKFMSRFQWMTRIESKMQDYNAPSYLHQSALYKTL